MITPLEIESKVFKSAPGGYSKKEVDSFLKEILNDYEKMYKENIEFKDKLAILQDGIQYYKSMEENLQKTLLLAEKTADETRSNARAIAAQIEKDAELKAQELMSEARKELVKVHNETEKMIKNFEISKIQIKQSLLTQLEFVETKCNVVEDHKENIDMNNNTKTTAENIEP